MACKCNDARMKYKRHLQVGMILKRIAEIHNEMEAANAKPTKATFRKLYKLQMTAKCILDDDVCLDISLTDAQAVRCYYGAFSQDQKMDVLPKWPDLIATFKGTKLRTEDADGI